MADLVRLPNLTQGTPIVDDQGRPSSTFLRYINDAFKQIGEAINAIADIPEIQDALAELDAATQAAQAAADAANTAAGNAQQAADTTTSVTSLANSYVDGLTLSAADAGTSVTVTVSNHTRVYGDGTSVSVTGGTIPSLPYSTLIYIYYDQPSRAGGAVAYQTTTSVSDAAQTNDRHVVGSIITPDAGQPDNDGSPVLPPGPAQIRQQQFAP